MYNVKRYCANKARTFSKSPELFITYITFMLALLLDNIFEGVPVIITIFALLGVVCYSIIENKKLIKESYFFEDVLEIIEKIEKKV